MTSTSDIHTLLEEIASKGASLDEPDHIYARRELLAAARSLCYKLETPVESLLRICWAEAQTHPAIRTGVEMNLFEKLADDGGAVNSNGQLASMTNSDTVLLSRILKHLAAARVIQEVDADTYAPTALSNALIEPKYRDAFPTVNDVAGPPLRQLHKYLASTGFKNPTNPTDGPFRRIWPQHTSPHLCLDERHPLIHQQFGNFMAGYQQGRPSWLDFFPAEDQLVKGLREDDDAVLLVDVGGGMGQDLEEDQEEPVERAKAGLAEKGIKAMAHDFFTPQPIKGDYSDSSSPKAYYPSIDIHASGGRASYLHSVLHDWPDAKCKEILSSLRPALTKGYSKLLINEVAIPNRGAPAVSTGLDLLLMAVFSSGQRTEKQWQELLERVGFRLVRVWGV
ncbi:MAG: hypothetical protein ALECFALPRED_008770 [Alectoria fallacina]|uniref:O-methyltransferase C-terminal domain-containing protein n=1 Tax=Alectoria fallacina TaxID=1903189 RepID=A0A8H3J4M0_9LECA|nr:MAG: hypothetical protein ALECFALPRED_008770 [Alectoria fallacina]